MSEPLDTIERLGLTVRAEFVPLSKSRNAESKDERGNKVYTLNWKVTVAVNGRETLTTDYQAGMAHCPSYNQGARMTLDYVALIEHETETGRAARPIHNGHTILNGKAIEPKSADVLYSLAMDSDVLDYGAFEQWAEEFGYDPDSRKAESIYRACLEIALKLRAGLGDSGLAALRNAFQDY